MRDAAGTKQQNKHAPTTCGRQSTHIRYSSQAPTALSKQGSRDRAHETPFTHCSTRNSGNSSSSGGVRRFTLGQTGKVSFSAHTLRGKGKGGGGRFSTQLQNRFLNRQPDHTGKTTSVKKPLGRPSAPPSMCSVLTITHMTCTTEVGLFR